MFISKIEANNWKNFSHIETELSRRTFLVGGNATGKSNFLSIFRFLRNIAKPLGGGLQGAVSEAGGFSKIRSLSARSNQNIALSISFAEIEQGPALWKYSLEIKFEKKSNKAVVVKEEAFQGTKKVFTRPSEADLTDPERLYQTHMENTALNKGFRDVVHHLAGISYHHLVPQLLRSPESASIDKLGEDYFGRNFVGRVNETKVKQRDSRLKKIEDALKMIVSRFDNLQTTKDNSGVPHLRLTMKHWRPNGGFQFEDQFSDGTLRLIGLFWSILETDHKMLLLEEPELYLNQRVVQQLAPLMKRLQYQNSSTPQIIISTHSPALLSDQGIGTREVILLRPNKEGTAAVNVSKIQDVVNLVESGITIGEAVLPLTDPQNIENLLSE
jgi:predicted ATPase